MIKIRKNNPSCGIPEEMGVSKQRKLQYYYRIYETLYEEPFRSILDVSVKTKLSRNTVAKYLKDMRENHILVGPYLSLKPALDYEEHIHLLNFFDHFLIAKWLKGFPHILQTAASLGDWNTLIVADRPLDLSRITGFEKVVYQGSKGFSFTPKAVHTSWDDAFTKIHEKINERLPEGNPKKKRLLDWNEKDWKLFHTFKYDTRKVVTSTLEKVKVQYRTYTEWMETLEDHCTTHTGFYPGGYYSYLTHCFLFSTDHKESVKSLFSLIPTTSLIMETGKNLLVFATVPHDLTRDFISLIYDVRRTGVINHFKSAVLLQPSHQRKNVIIGIL